MTRMWLLVLPLLVTVVVVRTEVCEEEAGSLLQSSYTAHRTCTQKHIKQSLKSNVGCKPVTVVLELPWPNNTAVQQVGQNS